mgnify:FL=1
MYLVRKPKCLIFVTNTMPPLRKKTFVKPTHPQEYDKEKNRHLPKLLFAIKTSVPLCFAPYAMALPALAPITTKVRPKSDDVVVLLVSTPEMLKKIR